MKNKYDRRAELAFKWMFVPLVTVMLGFAATNIGRGWDAIAYFFLMLFVSIAACLPPVILGVLALRGGTSRKEKALLAVMAPLMALFVYFVSFGGHAN